MSPHFVECARPTFEPQDRLAPAQRAVFVRQHEREEALARQLIGQAERQYGNPGTR